MSTDIARRNEAELDRLRNDMAQSLVGKVRYVLVRMDIPVPMDPAKNIYQSISYYVDGQGIIHVGSDLPYAPVLEWGRDPGKAPPFEPIYEWVKKKVGFYQDIKTDADARRIAWAIVTKIKQEGVKGRYFFRISIEEWIRGV